MCIYPQECRNGPLQTGKFIASAGRLQSAPQLSVKDRTAPAVQTEQDRPRSHDQRRDHQHPDRYLAPTVCRPCLQLRQRLRIPVQRVPGSIENHPVVAVRRHCRMQLEIDAVRDNRLLGIRA